MGRPYLQEMALLEATYSFSAERELRDLGDAVDSLRSRSLLVVGSGGSLGASAFAAKLHEERARLPARAMTPLDFVQHPIPQSAGVLLLSAGGGNPDIMAAARHAIDSEYAPVIAVSTRTETPLKGFLDGHPFSTGFEIVGPSKKDGFLATNSLVLTCTALARAYGVALPPSLPSIELLRGALSDPSRLDVQLRALLEGVGGKEIAEEYLDRQHITLLAHGWGVVPALDLESKWAESGFGSVGLTDPRNFAHGRHLGLSRRLEDTLVLGLQDGQAPRGSSAVLSRTLKNLPAACAAAVIGTPLAEAAGALDLLVRVFLLTGLVGQRHGMDPGRPRVPAFGRTLYRGGISKQASRASKSPRGLEDLWIGRKVTPLVWASAGESLRSGWRDRCGAWMKRAEATVVGGVALDYDGTLCETRHRHSPPSPAVGTALTRLLHAGLLIGIASGRGTSVIDGLRAILPEDTWHLVLVGMYNGTVQLLLSDEVPTDVAEVPSIGSAADALRSSAVVAETATIVERPRQLSIRPRMALPDGLLHRFVVEALQSLEDSAEIRAVASGHSVDVIPNGSSKAGVVAEMERQLNPSPSSSSLKVISIGDQGQAGGNDFDFLAHPLGLSVERASSSFESCWNVAAAGARRTVALLGYLEALRPDSSGQMHWSPHLASRFQEAGGCAPDAAKTTTGRGRVRPSRTDGRG